MFCERSPVTTSVRDLQHQVVVGDVVSAASHLDQLVQALDWTEGIERIFLQGNLVKTFTVLDCFLEYHRYDYTLVDLLYFIPGQLADFARCVGALGEKIGRSNHCKIQ